MATLQPVMTSSRRAIIFGSQGSSSIFSAATARRAEDDAQQSAARALLLSRCHTAFLEDCLSLDVESRRSININLADFHDQKSLLVPIQSFHGNPTIQATTICLYQLLHYLAEVDRSGLDPQDLTDQILETTGICSGLLPATVVAASKTLESFISFGVAAFRLAFWIAFRSVRYGYAIENASNTGTSWSLVVLGLSRSELEEKLEEFKKQGSRTAIRVSAISSPTLASVTGPNSDLLAFQDGLGPGISTRFAEINAWYHGGEQLESALEAVLRDLEERLIPFPAFSDLQVPIRSSCDGTLLDKQASDGPGLARWVVHQMLISPVDWLRTSSGMMTALSLELGGQQNVGPQIISFGPSSESLFTNLKANSLSHRLEYRDLSMFKAGQATVSKQTPQDAIAIVGMGVHFPKGHGEDELWNTLSNGLNAISEVPGNRFEITRYYDADGSAKSRTMATRDGAFLDDIWTFDNAFFNITPREAKSMDPQQRILLHTAQSALDDAGYIPDATLTFQRKSMGCYIGVATGDYTDNLRDDIDVFYSPGTLRAFHSGRLSFVHKFSGPSIVTDTACSSSLVSVYQACRAIQNGDCTAALAGGVNAICSPDMYLGLSRGHFLSPTGGCKPFDAAADGYCRAEGCGIFVLKPLSSAIAENDQIRGVIKGVEANQSGNAHSITHPHSETQTMLFQRLFQRTNISPATVSVVEAHGTGTQAGDAREISSLQNVFGNSHSVKRPLIISSIKGNIGHCEAASGAAGLAKLLLMLRKGKVPKQAGFSKLNPKLTGLEDAGMVIPTENREWRQSGTQPRRALLNNFGAAGSNVALLLEERPQLQLTKIMDERPCHVFNLSAKSRKALQTMISEHLEFLNQGRSLPSLKDICYTATARRQIYDHRISMVCNSVEDMKVKLEKASFATVNPSPPSKLVVFLFSGQGSLYRGMSEGLMDTCAYFREQVHHCDKIVQDLGFPSFLGFFSGGQAGPGPLMDSVEMVSSQCACFSLQYSLARLLMSWNIVPTHAAGHSLGEYAAFAVAGALSLEDALRIVATRAQLMAEQCTPNSSGMLACKASASVIEEILKGESSQPSLDVACRNSSNDCAVSGSLVSLTSFEETCKKSNIKAKRLDVPCGYHSSAMDPITEPLKALGRSVRWLKPIIPVASGVHGRLLEAEDLTDDYFAMHARQPVRFSDVIQSIDSAGGFRDAQCLELGPHPTVSTLVHSLLASKSDPPIPALKKGQDGWLSISSMLSELSYTKGDIKWREVFAGSQAAVTSLPGYPLNGSEFVVPFHEGSKGSVEQSVAFSDTGFKLLPRIVSALSTKDMFQFETTTGILGDLISGHDVGGTPICPASVYHEVAMEAAQTALSLPKDHILVMGNMRFANPLTRRTPIGTQTVQVQLHKVKGTDSAEVEILVERVPESSPISCATTTITSRNQTEIELRWLREAALVKRQLFYFDNTSTHSTFQTKLLYENIFSRVVRYSKGYQTLLELKVSSSGLEGIGTFMLPYNTHTENCIISPAFTDTLLHTAGFIANLTVKPTEICICSHVEMIEILYDDIDPSQTFTIYSHLFDAAKGSLLADAIVVDAAGRAVAVAREMEFKRLQLTSFQRVIQSPAATFKKTVEPLDSLTFTPAEPSSTSENTVVSSPNGYGTPKTSESSHDGIKRIISGIFSDACGFPENELDYSRSFDALGIDSLMQIEITGKLEQAFPKSSLGHDTLEECDTIQELEKTLLSQLVSEDTDNPLGTRTNSPKPHPKELLNGTAKEGKSMNAYNDERERAESNPVPLNTHSNDGKTSLFCFHDGSGQVSMYKKLCHHDRNLYGFFDPDYASQNPRPTSLHQMAARYAALVRKRETPSILLCGWSFGGVVAFEAATQLQSAGFDVKGLILIDSPLPRNHQPLPEGIITHVLSNTLSTPNSPKKNRDIINPHLLTEFKHNAALLGTYSPPTTTYFKTVMLRSRDILDTEALCGVKYDWLSSQRARDEAVKGWEGILGGKVDVLEIPGNHFEAFDEKYIAETSKQLMKACQIIDRTA